MAYNIGDSIGFDVSFDYQGPRYSGAKLRCVVGVAGTIIGFDEKCWTEINVLMPETMSWDRFSQRVIVILKDVKLGEIYDTYVKLMPKIFGESVLFWYGPSLVSMGEAFPDSEFRNLTVVVS